MSTPTVTAVPIMSSLSHTLSFTPNRPLRQQKHQLSPPRSYKSENSRLPHLSAAMNVTNHNSRRSHPYHTTTHAESSTDDLRTPPTPPHPQMQPLLPSLPSILEPPFAPSSAGRFSASTTAVSTTPYPANATTPTSNSFVTTTPFASSTSIDSLTSSSSSSSPLYHCRWRHCFRKFHGPELLYQHLCDDHVGRHARGNLCLECHWEDCQTVTNKRDHITSHLRVHVPLTPLRCRICDKRYKRRQDLKKHERKHLERLELSSTQLAGSELSSIVHPLPGTVLPDTHHSRHTTTTATTPAYHHHPYATPSYPPSASSSATSLRSGSPVHRPLASPSMAPPPSLPPVNLHPISPHHNHSNTHRPPSSASLPPPSHSHHHPSTLPALTLGKSASPPSPFTASHNNGVRGGGSFTSQPTTYSYPSQSHYNISPPSSSTYTSTAPPHSYSYSSQPSHPLMASNSPPATAPLSRFHHSQPPLHLPLPTTSHASGYRQPQPTSMEEC